MLKISVIIPVYNVEEFIDRCIQSVLNQDYSNIEVILVNDGSTDNSGFICEKYAIKDSRVRVYHKENTGQSGARNLGIEKSTGDYIVFLDSDDFWIDKKLRLIVNILEKECVDLLMFKAYSYYGSIKEERYIPFSNDYTSVSFEGDGKEVLSNILEYDYSFGWCPIWYFIKKSVIEKNKLYFIDNYLCEDVNYVFKLWNNVKSTYYLDEFIYVYRRDNEKSTVHQATFKFCNDLVYMIKENLELIDEYNIDDKLKNLLFINSQYLLKTVYFWFDKYSEYEKKLLIEKINDIDYIYKIDKYYRDMMKINDRVACLLLRIFNIRIISKIWSFKKYICINR